MGGGIGEVIDCSKFGSLEKLLQVICFAPRFVLNLKAKQMGSPGLQESLPVTKMGKSEMLWLRNEQRIAVQGDTFEKVKHSLNLIYDEHFLLRSKTRHSEFDKFGTSRKLLLLLRIRLHFTNIVIRDSHEKVFHYGINGTLNFLRNNYWLIRGRQSIKSLLRQCVICKYINTKTDTPPATAALLKFSLDYSFPYQIIGLDYAGVVYFKSCDHT